MARTNDELIVALYEALAALSLGIDDARRTMQSESTPMRRLGELARKSRPLLDSACAHLAAAGFGWDGRRFVSPEPILATVDGAVGPREPAGRVSECVSAKW